MCFRISAERITRAVCLFVVVAAVAAALPARAEVASAVRVKVLLAALSMDRTLKDHAEGGIVVGILGSCDMGGALQEAAGKSINGMALVIQPLGDVEGEGLKDAVKKHGVDILYVCAAGNLGAVAGLAAREKIVTLAEKAAWVEDRLVLGVGDNNGRPELVLNVNAAKDAGADFDARIFGIPGIKVIK
jgi:hypothetical protein